MAAYHRVYDSRHLQADCKEPGSAPVIEYGLPLLLKDLFIKEKWFLFFCLAVHFSEAQYGLAAARLSRCWRKIGHIKRKRTEAAAIERRHVCGPRANELWIERDVYWCC